MKKVRALAGVAAMVPAAAAALLAPTAAHATTANGAAHNGTIKSGKAVSQGSHLRALSNSPVPAFAYRTNVYKVPNQGIPIWSPGNQVIGFLFNNGQVVVTCWYYGNTRDGYWDHITYPQTGHIDDYYVNLGDRTPPAAGIPFC
jgi:hypothetical protein